MLGWGDKVSKLREGNHALQSQKQQETDGLHVYHLAEGVTSRSTSSWLVQFIHVSNTSGIP